MQELYEQVSSLMKVQLQPHKTLHSSIMIGFLLPPEFTIFFGISTAILLSISWWILGHLLKWFSPHFTTLNSKLLDIMCLFQVFNTVNILLVPHCSEVVIAQVGPDTLYLTPPQLRHVLGRPLLQLPLDQSIAMLDWVAVWWVAWEEKGVNNIKIWA